MRTVGLILDTALPDTVGSLRSIPTLTGRLLSALARDASCLNSTVLSFGRALWRSSAVFITAAAILSSGDRILIGSTLYPRLDGRSRMNDGPGWKVFAVAHICTDGFWHRTKNALKIDLPRTEAVSPLMAILRWPSFSGSLVYECEDLRNSRLV